MPTITINTFTVTQTPAQADIKLVTIKYSYTLECTDDECAINESASIKIDIFNEDEGSNAVASNQDVHTTDCEEEGYTVTNKAGEEEPKCGKKVTRTLVVGESLLETSVGDDPIKITVKGASASGGIIDSVTSSTVITSF